MCGTAAVPTKIHGAIAKILSDLKLARFPTPSSLPSRLYLDHSHCPVLAPATLAALPSTRAIPDRDVFYVADPHQLHSADYTSRRAIGHRRSETMEKIDRKPPAYAKQGHLDEACSRNPRAEGFCVDPVRAPESERCSRLISSG